MTQTAEISHPRTGMMGTINGEATVTEMKMEVEKRHGLDSHLPRPNQDTAHSEHPTYEQQRSTLSPEYSTMPQDDRLASRWQADHIVLLPSQKSQ